MKIMKMAGAAVGGAVLLLGLTAAPAMAQPAGELEQSAVSEECGSATLTFTNNTTGFYAWHYGFGDNAGVEPLEHGDFVSVGPMSTEEVTVEFVEDEFGGGAFVSYGTFAGPEQDFFLANEAIGVDTDCAEGEDPPPNGDDPEKDDVKPTMNPCTDALEQLEAAGVPAALLSPIAGFCALLA